MSGYSFFNRTLVKASFLALCSCSLLLPNQQTAHAQSAQTTLHGSITYRERIALPPATVEVRLLDVSTPSAPP
ncbi:MAG: YbaY family lipoprotein [Acetobacter sp.]|uniref:YbaY family lipoprotein n=1 Tax=Acetobacter sp. TaxID=440 RepID=UPI003F8EB848